MKEKIVLGESPMFMALGLRRGPMSGRQLKTKKSVGKPTELVSSRILGRLQDNNSHEVVNRGN